MREIQKKLIKRLIKEVENLGLIRTNVDLVYANNYTESKSYLTWYYKNSKNLEETTHPHWIIDGYVLFFYHRLDERELKACLEILDSKEDSNLILGMTMLYNLKIKKNNVVARKNR